MKQQTYKFENIPIELKWTKKLTEKKQGREREWEREKSVL